MRSNPQKHGFVDDFRDWPYSSYQGLLSTRPTHLKRQETLEWFSGINGFRLAHEAVEIDNSVKYLVEGDDS